MQLSHGGYTRKFGVGHSITTSFSPRENRHCERNHCTVDVTITKLRLDDPKMEHQTAVDTTCFWKNQDINKTAFSSHQLIYGRVVKIPGILEGNVAIDRPTFTDEVTDILDNHHSAIQEISVKYDYW